MGIDSDGVRACMICPLHGAQRYWIAGECLACWNTANPHIPVVGPDGKPIIPGPVPKPSFTVAYGRPLK